MGLYSVVWGKAKDDHSQSQHPSVPSNDDLNLKLAMSQVRLDDLQLSKMEAQQPKQDLSTF